MTTPRATPGDGRPSAAARTRLAEELAAQLATSRIAWDAALLRSDAALATDDEAEIQAALDDHRLLLSSLEERLSEVVAAATAPGDAPPGGGAEAPVPPARPTVGQRTTPRSRRVASGLVGATAAVLAVVGLVRLDLPVETAGQVAGSAVPDRDGPVRPGATSDDVARVPGAEGGQQDTRRAELPPFSGKLPASATTASSSPPESADAAATVAEAEEPEPAQPARRADDGPRHHPPRFDALPDPAGGDPAEGEAAGDGPSARPLEELAERLRDRADGTDDVDAGVGARSRPLRELAEALREGQTPGPASEPGSGLG